jgi:hypothetical protein
MLLAGDGSLYIQLTKKKKQHKFELKHYLDERGRDQ